MATEGARKGNRRSDLIWARERRSRSLLLIGGENEDRDEEQSTKEREERHCSTENSKVRISALSLSLSLSKLSMVSLSRIGGNEKTEIQKSGSEEIIKGPCTSFQSFKTAALHFLFFFPFFFTLKKNTQNTEKKGFVFFFFLNTSIFQTQPIYYYKIQYAID